MVAKQQELGGMEEVSEEEDEAWVRGGKFGTSGANYFPIGTESE